MTYDEIIEQLEITKSKIKEIARNEYGGESWNDDLDALTEAADIVADYSVPHGRRRLRFHTDRRKAEPDSAGHAWKIRAAAESGI